MLNLSFVKKAITLLFFLCVGVCCCLPVLSQGWEKPYIGKDTSILYYPDQYAVYIRYGWKNDSTGILVIKGQLPQARYYSYNLYDDRTKSSLLALADFEIMPDQKGSNTYTITVVPERLKGNRPNQIVVPDSVEYTSIFLRYYVPQINALAGVPAPALAWYLNGAKQTLPKSLGIPEKTNEELNALERLIKTNPQRLTFLEKKLLSSATASLNEKERILCKMLAMPMFDHSRDTGQLSAFNFNASGTYPNGDNHYIVMPVKPKNGHVLMVRFKPPTFGNKLGDQSGEVRYFSLSQGNVYTNTSLTMYDAQFKVSKDGFIYVLVGFDDVGLRTKAKAMGINFMPLYYKDKWVLILRHMLPSTAFKNSIRAVAVFDNTKPSSEQEAQRFIGAYAIVGKHFSTKDILAFTKMGDFTFR